MAYMKLSVDIQQQLDNPENCAFLDLCLDMATLIDAAEATTYGQDTIEFINSDDLQTTSPCQMEWMKYKEETGAGNYFVDTVMALPSREDVKYLFLNTFERVKLAESAECDLSEEDFSVVFIARGPDDQSSGKMNRQSADVGSAMTTLVLQTDRLPRYGRSCETLCEVAHLTWSGEQLQCCLA